MLGHGDFNDAGLSARQEYLSAMLTDMMTILHLLPDHQDENGKPLYSEEDRITLWKQNIALIELLYPDGDYHFKAQLVDDTCDSLACTYLKKGDLENALDWLEKCAVFSPILTFTILISHTPRPHFAEQLTAVGSAKTEKAETISIIKSFPKIRFSSRSEKMNALKKSYHASAK